MTKSQAIFNRFLKGFISSSITTILASLVGVTAFNSTNELKTFLLNLTIPLFTGLLLALEKAINWTPPETPVPVEPEHPEPLENQSNE